MNLNRSEAIDLATQILESDNVSPAELVVCPSFVWLESVSRVLAGSTIQVGAQDCWTEPSGAFTGQISAEMLSSYCRYVLVGHSERRRDASENSALVGRKARAALDAEITPIICVGEQLETRSEGKAASFVAEQLRRAFAEIPEELMALPVVAYEPIWAIGTGMAASAQDAQEMAREIRIELRTLCGASADSMRVLYGGSVNQENAGSIASSADVDGFLVGGASLAASSFLAIARAC